MQKLQKNAKIAKKCNKMQEKCKKNAKNAKKKLQKPDSLAKVLFRTVSNAEKVQKSAITLAKAIARLRQVIPIDLGRLEIRGQRWHIMGERLRFAHLQQQNLPARVLGQPIGEHTPSRTRSDNDEIILGQR